MLDLSEIPVLETPRLRLRALAERDVDDLWPYVSDPELTKFMTWAAHGDRAAGVY